MQNLAGRLAAGFLDGPASERLGDHIQENDAAFAIGHQHAVTDAGESGGQQPTALPPGRRHPGDQQSHDHEAQQAPEHVQGDIQGGCARPEKEIENREGRCRGRQRSAGAPVIPGAEPHGHDEQQERVGLQVGMHHERNQEGDGRQRQRKNTTVKRRSSQGEH